MKSNNLAKMIGKRVVQSCITILLVTLFVFALIQMVPGDPVANYLGATATEEQIAYYRHLYGFDRPVIVQYLSWIGGLFRGTMGQSISYQSEIADIILPRLGTTLTMVIPAFIIGTITGILFGIIAAKNRGKTIDSVISFFANIGVSMPMFWLGMMGMLVFALKLRVLPSSGYVPITRDFGGWLSHMIMPIIVLSLGVNAGFVRLTRSSMLDVLGHPEQSFRVIHVTGTNGKGSCDHRPCQRRFQEGCYLQASAAQFNDPHRHHHGNAPGFHGGLHRPDRESVRHPGSWQRDDERHQQP